MRIEAIDEQIAKGGPYSPRWGWHDDHREADGTTAYLPALMQVRDEYIALLAVLGRLGAIGGKALQLGIGPCTASHDCMAIFFDQISSIDYAHCLYTAAGSRAVYPGADTHGMAAVTFARAAAPYDFLLIDAGHAFEDVRADHETYGEMVRPGGVIAFHDAIERPCYTEIGVANYLRTLDPQPSLIGTEVGIAWIIKQ